MNKLIVGVLAAGAFGGAIALAAPASAAPNCDSVIDKINSEEGYEPTSTEAWTCAVPIQANAWQTFPGQLRENWTSFPGELRDNWVNYPDKLREGWTSFPDKLRDGWTPGDEGAEAADAAE
ncbi:hypothetical protein ACRCUN_16350 [Mycobacterium sp. LTG2003]